MPVNSSSDLVYILTIYVMAYALILAVLIAIATAFIAHCTTSLSALICARMQKRQAPNA